MVTYINITQRYKYKLFMAGSNAGNYAIIKHLMQRYNYCTDVQLDKEVDALSFFQDI